MIEEPKPRIPRDDEKPFRIRPPRRPRGAKRTNDAKLWAKAFRTVGRYIQMGRRVARRVAANRARGSSSSRQDTRSHMQRCSVRVTYSANKSKGQWKAHAKYVERESATTTPDGKKGTGFDAVSSGINISSRVNEWQEAGDERMFKLIISPEFGQEIDLERHTRELLARMEKDLGTKLEWVAAAHFNTDHPHVHVILRGVDERGQALRLDKSYVKSGIRQHAQELATNQIGYRTDSQVLESQRNEVAHHRFTSLDQLIARGRARTSQQSFQVQQPTPLHPSLRDTPKDERARLVAARLRTLEKIGLAVRVNGDTWNVQNDFDQVLRSMQKAQDRQKLIAQHGALSSDARLPIQLTSTRDFKRLEGRVLVHGEEDSGRAYMLLEGTDARIHLIYHDAAIGEARANGKMKPDNFVVLKKRFLDKQPSLEIDDLGNAQAKLSDQQWLRDEARLRVRQGLEGETPQGWGGWLGEYQEAMARSVSAHLQQDSRPRTR